MGQRKQMKVSATHSALNLLSELKERYGEKLMFHQSGGCCDGSAPMCFPAKEYLVGNSDVKLGEIEGTPFYINEDQYEKWKHHKRITRQMTVSYSRRQAGSRHIAPQSPQANKPTNCCCERYSHTRKKHNG